MKRVLRIILFILVELLLIGGFLVSSFGYINTMVSIKYETESGDGCISEVSGDNLCLIKISWWLLGVLCLILSIALPVIYKKKYSKKT
jgi:preprotein translocase subunit SecG